MTATDQSATDINELHRHTMRLNAQASRLLAEANVLEAQTRLARAQRWSTPRGQRLDAVLTLAGALLMLGMASALGVLVATAVLR